MADTFPTDEFDAAPMHGGRHRIRRTAKHRILEFLKIAAFSAIVAVIGWVGLKGIDSLNFFKDNSAVSAQPVVAVQEPIVVVLDGTEQTGFATKWATTLSNAGFNVATAADYAPAAADYAPAAGGKVSTTVVYVRSTKDQFIAGNIAKKLILTSGTVAVQLSTEFTDAITVVLGTNLK